MGDARHSSANKSPEILFSSPQLSPICGYEYHEEDNSYLPRGVKFSDTPCQDFPNASTRAVLDLTVPNLPQVFQLTFCTPDIRAPPETPSRPITQWKIY